MMFDHPGPLAAGPEHAVVTPAYVAELFNQGANYYTLGLRAYYLVVPIILGLFGPYAMVVATLGILPVFYHADCAPPAREPQSGGQGTDDPVPPSRVRLIQRQDI
jgi:uncharacterized membrane protein